MARTVTRELLELLPDDWEGYCLLHKAPQQPELTYEASKLDDWMAANPLVAPEPRFSRFRRYRDKALDLCMPPVVRKIKQRLSAAFGRYLAHLPKGGQWRTRLDKLRRVLWGAPPQQRGVPSQWITL